MKRYSLLLLLAIFAFVSCKKKDENNLTPAQQKEALLIAHTWKSTGIYATSATTPLQTLSLSLDFKDGNGSATNVDNTIIVNGATATPLTTQWKSNDDGTLLSMKIPDPTKLLTFSLEALVTEVIAGNTTDIKMTLTATDLTLSGASGKSINLLGIAIPAGAEIRFTETGTSTTAATNNLLTAVTWKGEGLYTNGIKSGADFTTKTMKFGTNVLGINTVTISDIPSPVTWSINDAAAPTKLTLLVPTVGSTDAHTVELDISTLTATNLNLKGTSTTKVNIIITELDVNSELRMVAQ